MNKPLKQPPAATCLTTIMSPTSKSQWDPIYFTQPNGSNSTTMAQSSASPTPKAPTMSPLLKTSMHSWIIFTIKKPTCYQCPLCPPGSDISLSGHSMSSNFSRMLLLTQEIGALARRLQDTTNLMMRLPNSPPG